MNGDCTYYFEPTRGIRQGDPISLYIFIMCTEMLSQSIETEIKQKTWQPIKVSRKGPTLSHLFCADDLVLMSRADQENVWMIN